MQVGNSNVSFGKRIAIQMNMSEAEDDYDFEKMTCNVESDDIKLVQTDNDSTQIALGNHAGFEVKSDIKAVAAKLGINPDKTKPVEFKPSIAYMSRVQNKI